MKLLFKTKQMKQIIGVLAIIAIGAINLFAQPSISFNKSEHDFGNIANLNYPPAAFIFKNNGDAPAAVLMINKSNSVKVSYPTQFIGPGEENKILVYPDLNRIGAFSEKVEVVVNYQESPIVLSISGNVISVQECFPNPDNWNIRKIVVIDSDTKDPIPDANITMVHNMSQEAVAQTDKNGEWQGDMPIGQYHFALAATSYYPKEEDKYVNRSLPILFFELDMIPPARPVEQIIIAESEPDISEPEIDYSVSDSELPLNLYAANNLVLLLDVSYSMKSGNKMGLLKESIINLAGILRNIDNVSLITYAGSPSLIFKAVPGNNREIIAKEVQSLVASGITNGVKGLESAYFIANKQYINGGNNQIILATDGKFTGGNQQPQELQNMISNYAEKGIILSIIGFGVDEDAKMFMRGMAELGKGTYIHVSTKDDVSDTFINEIKSKSLKK